MEAPASRPSRVDIGFSGGQVLSLRLPGDAYESLRSALSNDGSPRWIELQSEDSQVQVDLAQVVYVRIDTERERIGF